MKGLVLLVGVSVFVPTLAFSEDDWGILRRSIENDRIGVEKDRIAAESTASRNRLSLERERLKREQVNTYILASVLGLAGLAIGLGIFYGKNPEKLKSLKFSESQFWKRLLAWPPEVPKTETTCVEAEKGSTGS